MYLNMQKEVTRAARPSLCGGINKIQQLGDGFFPGACSLKRVLKNKVCVTSREASTSTLLGGEINKI